MIVIRKIKRKRIKKRPRPGQKPTIPLQKGVVLPQIRPQINKIQPQVQM